MHLKTSKYQHQEEAVMKLKGLKVGALFMEQGTGKTRVALELAFLRLQANKIDKIVWFCPCSVIENLKYDIKKHSEGIFRHIIICGIQTLSSSGMTYLALRELFKEKRIFMIVDESTLVKNHRAIRSKRIHNLSKLCDYKLILNGTPVTKNEADLFYQMYILTPEILGFYSYGAFFDAHVEWNEKKRYIEGIKGKDEIYARIAPFSVQVLKESCLDLPNKKHKTRYLSLTDDQMKHYEIVLNDLMLDTLVDDFDDADRAIFRMFTTARLIISGRKITQWRTKPLLHEPFYTDPTDNPRIELLMNILDEFGDEKVIIWVEYTQSIYDIVSILGEQSVPYYGEMNLEQRNNALTLFREERQYLVANKSCGGMGLNLQYCHNVVYYDNDYDFGVRCQSEDRVHRIGQENDVTYIDMCAMGTLDEHMLEVLDRKEGKLERFRIGMVKHEDLRAIFFREKEETHGEVLSR